MVYACLFRIYRKGINALKWFLWIAGAATGALAGYFGFQPALQLLFFCQTSVDPLLGAIAVACLCEIFVLIYAYHLDRSNRIWTWPRVTLGIVLAVPVSTLFFTIVATLAWMIGL